MKIIYKEYHVSCDGDKCYTNLIDYGDSCLESPEERDKQFKLRKWVRIGGKDYCPDCKKKLS